MTSSASSSSKAEALRLEGNEYFKQGCYNKAVQSYSESLEIEVTPLVLSNRAQAYLKLNSCERALSDSTEALLRDPSLVKALYRRALALEKLKLYGRAQNDLQQLLKLESQNKEALELLRRLEGKIDVDIHKIRCFSKSEPVQSERRLKEVLIQKHCAQDSDQLDRINLSHASVADLSKT